MRPIVQRCRARTSRSKRARSRITVFQFTPARGRVISLKTTSIVASMRRYILGSTDKPLVIVRSIVLKC